METDQKSNGALVGLIIIIIILVLGGIYLWKVNLNKTTPSENTAVETSEDTTSLEADVNSIDLESLDEGI